MRFPRQTGAAGPLPPLIAALLAAFAVFSADALAEPAVTEQTEYYDVKGQVTRQVADEMFEKTPVQIKGIKYRAACYPDIRWRYTVTTDSDWCRVKTVSVTLGIIYRMPRWVDYPAASTEMQRNWDVFYTTLEKHEKGHGERNRAAAKRIESAISELKRRSCQELGDAVNETGNRLLAELSVEQNEYDDQTRRGLLERAVLMF